MTGKGFNVCPVLSGIKHAFHCDVSSLSVSIIKFKSLEFLGLCNIEFQERLKMLFTVWKYLGWFRRYESLKNV